MSNMFNWHKLQTEGTSMSDTFPIFRSKTFVIVSCTAVSKKWFISISNGKQPNQTVRLHVHIQQKHVINIGHSCDSHSGF